MRDEHVSPTIWDVVDRRHDVDSGLAAFTARSLLTLDAEPVAASQIGEQVAAPAAEIEDAVRLTDEGSELDAVGTAAEAPFVLLGGEVGFVVVGGGSGRQRGKSSTTRPLGG